MSKPTAERDRSRIEMQAAIVEAMSEAVVVSEFTQEGTIRLFNPAAEKLYGYKAEEIVGQSVLTLINQKSEFGYDAYMSQFLRPDGRVVHEVERIAVRRDGTKVPIHAYFQDLFFHRQRCVVAIISDISERKRREQLLEDSKRRQLQIIAALRQSNEDLDRFAYIASHDLKTPLRGIWQLAGWIAEDIDDQAKVLEHVGRLRHRVTRLENLLATLLQYSRITRADDDTGEFDASTVVEEVFELSQIGEGFTLQLEGKFPRIVGNGAAFELVMRNLIGNAMKHHGANSGSITVSCNSIEDGYEFAVIDDGEGIDPRYHEQVFEMFSTLKPRDAVEGSGMGLALVNKTLQTLGGSVRVESLPGQGASFIIRWPAGSGAEEPSTRALTEALAE